MRIYQKYPEVYKSIQEYTNIHKSLTSCEHLQWLLLYYGSSSGSQRRGLCNIWVMHPRHWADPCHLQLLTNLIQDLFPGISDPDGCSVVDGVLSVVDHGVVPDKVEVSLKLLQCVVLVLLNLLPHRPKVHRVSDDVQIVRNLEEEEGGWWWWSK